MAGDVGLEDDPECGTEAVPVAEPTLDVCSIDLSESAFPRLELVWPGKDLVQTVRQRDDGAWESLKGAFDYEACPLNNITNYPDPAQQATSLFISGDRVSCLRSLRPLLGQAFRLAYLDAPRIGVDDLEAAFRGDTNLVYSTWLSVMRTHLLAVEPLLARDGVVVIHVGENEAGAARLLADELFRGQHVGTVVWQRSYAPRNMPGMREFTSTHDCLIIYAKQKTSLPPVGLRRPPAGFSNPDDDPRGPWKADHKGAASYRENSDFDTFVPPYRWSLVEGDLPPGIWRISPLTGVIWGEPTAIGEYHFKVQAKDSSDQAVVKELAIKVLAHAETPSPIEVPWLFDEISTNGSLRIETSELPTGRLGESYSAICLAAGGTPHKADPKRPGSGRYWEFARDTLLRAYRDDAVYLGPKRPTAIPHPKNYAPKEADALVVDNQQTWWPGRVAVSGTKTAAFAGYTEDATKHLKALRAIGAIELDAVSAKPEMLMARLIDIFTGEDDLVLEVFAQAADLAATALKRKRRFVAMSGGSKRSTEISEQCAIPRLRAVIDGADTELEARATSIRLRADGYIPFAGGGSFATATLGSWIVRRARSDDFAELNEEYDHAQLADAILTVQGYLPVSGVTGVGFSFNGANASAIVLPHDEYLTPEVAGKIVSEHPHQAQATIFYYRASEDFDPASLPADVTCKRVPFELGI